MPERAAKPQAPVSGLDVRAYKIPTDRPESDGTFRWEATTIVVVHAHGGSERGLGYTYGPTAVADLIQGSLAEVVKGHDALAPQVAWMAMRAALRNSGQAGVGAMALSAVDLALHDLRARLLGLSLSRALGAFHDRAAVYGSGGFCTYGPEEVAEQLGGWVEQGIGRVKMKVGRHPKEDPARMAAARQAIGEVPLMVDANGAFSPWEAIGWSERYAAYGVAYLEEPVSSDDLEGLRAVRRRSPAGMAVAAGEYAWSARDARRLLEAESVDILQADITRCGGLTGLARIGGLCAAHGRPFSAHCAPALSAHGACAIETFVHLEYFHDHVRIEGMLFDGTLSPEGGFLRPDPDRAGNGLELRADDAAPHEVWP